MRQLYFSNFLFQMISGWRLSGAESDLGSSPATTVSAGGHLQLPEEQKSSDINFGLAVYRFMNWQRGGQTSLHVVCAR